MKKNNIFLLNHIIILICIFTITAMSQQIKWLTITELQAPINEIGAEYEGEFTDGNQNFFSWPAQYSLKQNTTRMKGLWIGSQNFYDPVTGTELQNKVVATGPRDAQDRFNHIFPQEIKLIGKFNHPEVIVDGVLGGSMAELDVLDEIDDTMKADRMVLVKLNTSIGISVTKKVLAFDHPDHDNYFINEYTFKNTGIYDVNGNVHEQQLKDVYFYFVYRYAFAGVTSDAFGSTWGAFASQWGNSTINHSFGDNPGSSEFTDLNSPYYQLRGFYSYYGPSSDRLVTYDEDWGCPNEGADGLLGSAKYAGTVTLHADQSSGNSVDDLSQPHTTWFIGSDINSMQGGLSDAAIMADRYTIMSEGDPDQPHSAYVGNDYPINYSDPRRQNGGGTSQGQGYGPYTLDFGDSIKIVFAEGVSGLSWEECRRIGSDWIQYYNGETNKPQLINPDDGSVNTNHNDYKKRWVETGVDSIIQTYNNARDNYNSGYNIKNPPPPPNSFKVESGGNAIILEWAENAVGSPNFDGYYIYRSRGTSLQYETVYEKIFECDATNLVHQYHDTSAVRGFDYYYYIQSKSNGSDNDLHPGIPLVSSMFWTITTVPAQLQRPPADNLSEIRVVPNPYDIRARELQFGANETVDRINFYGLPDACKLTILSERGDIIWQKDHTNGTGDENWDSKTSSGQIVVSGIYILYVEVTEDVYALDDRVALFDVYDEKLKLIYNEGDSMHSAGDLVYRKGQSAFRKFVIIR